MDRKTWIAIGLSMLIFIGWQKFILQKYQQNQSVVSLNEKTEGPASGQVTEPKSKVTVNPPASMMQMPLLTTSVKLRSGEIKVSNGSRLFEGWTYRPQEGAVDKAVPVEMSTVVGAAPQLDFAVDQSEYSGLSSLVSAVTRISETEYRWSAIGAGASLTKGIKVFPEEGYADVSFSAEFKGSKPRYAFVSLVSQNRISQTEERDRKLIYFSGNKYHSLAASKPTELTDVLLPTEWIGVDDRYFLFSVVDKTGGAKALLQPLAGDQNRVSLVYPVNSDRASFSVRVFFGPKSLDLLRRVHPSLDQAVDFGWLTPLAYGILHFMKWLFSFLGNYGVAIIVLTIILKIILYPLTYKSMKSMKKMTAIQPQLQKLRDRYKDDKEALNREMLQLMRTQGYNPVAGCLPMLIQMPIFFALYRVLYSSFELYRSPFAFWIQDLSKQDPWYVTPVILTAVMFLQQKLTPSTATDPAQQKMIQWMPVIFGVFMLGLPAGLTIYMLTNAIVSIIQQLILNKKLGIQPTHVALKTG